MPGAERDSRRRRRKKRSGGSRSGGVVYTTRDGEGVTREMINTRRSELLDQIKEVESVLSKERRRTRRAKRSTERLRAKLSTAGSSVVRSPSAGSMRSARSFGQVPQQGESKNAAHYFRERRKGRKMAMLLADVSDHAKFEDMTMSRTTMEYRPESVRAELDGVWDLRHPRYQTELTRYVDVVIRQNLPPFQSTAMMP